jgi:hypothetical protein
VDIVGVEFNLNGLLDNAVHVSGFRGEDGRIVELNVVSLVDNINRVNGFCLSKSWKPLIGSITRYR